ncbi:MAG: hypothetical protein V4628_05210 [Pseudomonadota bacterium]
MKTEIQRFDAVDDEGTIHTIVELHEELAGRTSYATVAHVQLYVAFCTIGGELVSPMGGGTYKTIRDNKVLRRMRAPAPLRPSVLNH